jgi:hypothetical protein
VTDAEDKPVSIDHLAATLNAYKKAKENEAIHTAKAKEWKTAADCMRDIITFYMYAAGSNVGTVNGRTACRYSQWESPHFDIKTFREKEPSLAEEYTTKLPKSRFTAYGDSNDQAKDRPS